MQSPGQPGLHSESLGNEKQMSSGSEGKPRAEKPSSWEKEQISSL